MVTCKPTGGFLLSQVRSVGKRAQATSSRRRKSERKITRMVVIVVAVFVLCWLPFYALNIVNLVVVLPRDFRGLYFFVVVLSYANSCANPILYGFLSDNFKRGFRKALCRTSRRVKNNDRAGTEVQRPTEEWGGIVLQTIKSEEVSDIHRGTENEDKGDGHAEDRTREIRDTCEPSEVGGQSGVTGNSVTQLGQTCKMASDKAESIRNPADGGGKPPVSAAVSNVRNSRSQPEELLDKNSVLEISYL